jgi:hypothetical protein
MPRWRTTARDAEFSPPARWRAWRVWRVWRAWQACVWLAGGRAWRAGVALSVAATCRLIEFSIIYESRQ